VEGAARQRHVRKVFEEVGRGLGIEGSEQDEVVSDIMEVFLGSDFFRWEISNSGMPILRDIIMKDEASTEVCISQ
jgi:hypothetical protein